MIRKIVLVASLVLGGAVLAPQATAGERPERAIATYAAHEVSVTRLSQTTLLEQATGIGPGSHLLMTFDAEPDSVYGCTANFVWAAGGSLYLGAAGHCFLPFDAVATHGVDADYDPSGTHVEVCVSECTNGGMSGFVITGNTVALGPVAYARQSSSGADDAEDVGYDFGLVEIPEEHHDLVRTTMPVFGGPETDDGTLDPGDVTCHYGNGVVFGEIYPTMGRVGTGIIELDGAWFAATPSSPGDSGSAMQTCVLGPDGLVGHEAIGALTHLTSLGVAGTTVEQAVEMAREAGLSIQLLLGGDGTGGDPGDPGAGSVTVSSIDPSTAAAGEALRVTIDGSGFADGADAALAGGRGRAPRVQVVSVEAESIVADVTVPRQARDSAWDVVVANPDGSTAALDDGFTVTSSAQRGWRTGR
jgi:hypothetical protein